MATYKYINLLLKSDQLNWLIKHDLEFISKELLKYNYELYSDKNIDQCLDNVNKLAKMYYKAIENAKLCINLHLKEEGYSDKTYLDVFITDFRVIDEKNIIIKYNNSLIFKYKIKTKNNITWTKIDDIWKLK